MIDAVLVVDMQQGLFRNDKRHDPEGVTQRINLLIDAARQAGRAVLFIQHDGLPGESVEVGTPGWELLPGLHRQAQDLVIRKTACDSFLQTSLEATLEAAGIRSLCICGCCTDFCVDTTIRTAAGKGYAVFVPSDGHTTAHKVYLAAPAIITHHNFVWSEFIAPGPGIEVEPAAVLATRFAAAPLA